jgi:hypothetical protein
VYPAGTLVHSYIPAPVASPTFSSHLVHVSLAPIPSHAGRFSEESYVFRTQSKRHIIISVINLCFKYHQALDVGLSFLAEATYNKSFVFGGWQSILNKPFEQFLYYIL